MNFPKNLVGEAQRVAQMQVPPTSQKISIVLDTDTYNEVDDQFAIAYALNAENIEVQAIYAAPFYNQRSNGPEDGMQQSYREIHKLLGLMGRSGLQNEAYVKRGSTRFLTDQPERSEAVDDLIAKAQAASPEQPLWVVAIGAITNIANAILLEPSILENITLVWLGGQALESPKNFEFNLMQDTRAARTVLESRVPLVLLPCDGVVDALTTTMHELKACIGRANPLCDYLVEIVASYNESHFAWSKVIWDIAAIAWLRDIGCQSSLRPCPILNQDLDWGPEVWQKVWHRVKVEKGQEPQALTWSFDPSRHLIQYVHKVNRDAIFRDLFTLLRS